MDLQKLIKPHILELEPYHSAREKVMAGLLLDANENPFPHFVQGVPVNRYPDPRQTRLRDRLAEFVGLRRDNVLAGSGSDEVLDWVFKVFGDREVAIAEPTYGMYRVMAEIYHIGIFEWHLDAQFRFQADEFLAAVPDTANVLFLCSPNNPTGNLLDSSQILSVARQWGRIVVVDEAYIEFSASESLCGRIHECPNLVVMRTFSKALGRAGARLGYAVASPEVIAAFLKVKAPYNLSALTMEEGIRTLSGLPQAWSEVELIRAERSRMAAALEKIRGVTRVLPSDANFVSFYCQDASGVCRRLYELGTVVRDRSGMPGLENCIRVTVGSPEENSRFLAQLSDELENGPL